MVYIYNSIHHNGDDLPESYVLGDFNPLSLIKLLNPKG